MKKRLIIAIDGPAASGKSTTAKLLAQKLGYVYLDTGAMYRACALQAKYKDIDLNDTQAVQVMLESTDIRIELSGLENVILLDGKDVSTAIRENEISGLASDISAIPAVRYKMVELQRKMGNEGGVILDGRDIGTFVFPDAEIKFFLTASPEVRAHRRCLELETKEIYKTENEVLAELTVRDKNDSERDLAPLSKAADAIEINTDLLTIEQQVQILYDLILQRMEI
jgi:CMP/dCMP kinase